MAPLPFFSLLAATVLPACHREATPPSGEPTGDVSTSESPAPEDPVAALGLRIRAQGPEGAVPALVAFSMVPPLYANVPLGGAPPAASVRISPEVPGSLRVSGSNEAEWVPTNGFRPGTAYTVTVPTWDGAEVPLSPPEAWTYRFETPAFSLVRATLRAREPGALTVTLVYAAAVDPEEVGRHARFRLGEEDIRPSLVERGDAPNEVRVRLVTGGRELPAGRLKISVSKGVSYAFDKGLTAPAFDQTQDVHDGPPIEILAMNLREGQSGFYVDVVCKDNAAQGEERYYWDRDEYDSYWISPRCLLDERAASTYVHTDPATPLSIAPGPGGFRIFGDFGRGPLKVTIDAGAPTVDGGVLHSAQEKTYTVPARSPVVAFQQKGRYLPRSAFRGLGIRYRNVDKVEVAVRHVPPENLAFWLSGDEPMDQRTSNLIARTTLPVQGPPDQERDAWLDLATVVPDVQRGVYEIEISGGGVSDRSRLLLTDLQLIAKASAPGLSDQWAPSLSGWVLDSHTGNPVSGVDLSVIRKSGQVLGTCLTDATGGCTVTVRQDSVDPSAPVAMIARKGAELTYLRFEDLRLDLPAGTSGTAYTSVRPWQASLWTDRGVYRPGETAHVSALLRGKDNLAPAEPLPVVLKLYDPQGREVRRRPLDTNPAGMVSADLSFGDYAATGAYRASLEVGEVVVGEETFNIEEFVPERMAVEAHTPGPDYALGAEVPVEVGARWLFGGSAEGARVELTCRLQAGEFKPDAASDYTFGPAWLDQRPRDVSLGTVEGTLGEAGQTDLSCPAASASFGGPAELVATASVFEGESGRTTVNEARAALHPAPYYLGLKTAAKKAEAGRPFAVAGAVVDWKGKTSGAVSKVELEVFRMEEEYGWWWDEEDDTTTQRRTLRPAREHKQTVAVQGGAFSFNVTPESDSAGTLVRVRAGDAVTELFVEGNGRRWWWENSAQSVDATPRPQRPTALVVSLPEQAKVGETVTATVAAPYAGRVLYTVETDHVLQAEWRSVQAGANTWSFKVDQFTPNVYVSAFLVKDPHAESAESFLPDRAFGVRSLTLEPVDYTLPVTVSAPKEALPNSRLDVTVNVGTGAGSAYVTVAAVDEGILQLTRFQDPDPLSEIFEAHALGVTSYETVGWTLLMPPGGPSSRTGGDGAGGPPNRVQMVKPVALWSGLVPVGPDGTAKVPFDLPTWRGELRVMAVAATAQRMGAASTKVTVRDPIVLSTTLPRFLMTGDQAQIPVFVSNQSGSTQKITLALEASALATGATPDMKGGAPPPPPLSFLGEPRGTLSLKNGESGTAVFQVKVSDLPGAAKLRVVATAGKLRSFEELDVPIQAAGVEARQVEHLKLASGKNDLKSLARGFVPGTDRSTFWVTTNPYAEALTHLRGLVEYPFG